MAWECSDDRGAYISVAFEEPSLAPGRYTLVKTGVEKGYTMTYRGNMPTKSRWVGAARGSPLHFSG